MKGKTITEQQALDHLKTVYEQFVKSGGNIKKFTIRHYNVLNNNPKFYIDVYVKRFGGWNNCLKKAKIPLGTRAFTSASDDAILNHVKKVYKTFKSFTKEKTFRMVDYNEYNDSDLTIQMILKRFHTWNNLMRELNIPIGRSRGLTLEQIAAHVLKVYNNFKSKENDGRVFSKEMYEKYNFTDDVYISSKLVERRFGGWSVFKQKHGIA